MTLYQANTPLRFEIQAIFPLPFAAFRQAPGSNTKHKSQSRASQPPTWIFVPYPLEQADEPSGPWFRRRTRDLTHELVARVKPTAPQDRESANTCERWSKPASPPEPPLTLSRALSSRPASSLSTKTGVALACVSGSAHKESRWHASKRRR